MCTRHLYLLSQFASSAGYIRVAAFLPLYENVNRTANGPNIWQIYAPMW